MNKKNINLWITTEHDSDKVNATSYSLVDFFFERWEVGFFGVAILFDLRKKNSKLFERNQFKTEKK